MDSLANPYVKYCLSFCFRWLSACLIHFRKLPWKHLHFRHVIGNLSFWRWRCRHHLQRRGQALRTGTKPCNPKPRNRRTAGHPLRHLLHLRTGRGRFLFPYRRTIGSIWAAVQKSRGFSVEWQQYSCDWSHLKKDTEHKSEQTEAT